MQFYSTKQKNYLVSFKEAVLKGLPDDNGLFMPVEIPMLPAKFYEKLNSMSFQEISFEVAKNLLKEDIPQTILKEIIYDAQNFNATLVKLEEQIFVLELFHGPTLAFKDFAARFMAKLMSYFIRNSNRELTILVATSGDTGSAVAHGFYNIQGIRVVILYPSGKISAIQENQLTTMGGNITALEIKGTFDDCQKLVKQAFLDIDLANNLSLTSANSINIARLIPQSFYYFYAYAQLKNKNHPNVFSVPCGNFGNLTGGLIAKKMRLPVLKFIAATNINDSVPKYLQTGVFKPQSIKKTISNAMDVGNPSNFARILDMYNDNAENMRQDIWSAAFSDEQTKLAIQEVFRKYNYILDPHGAVGYLGLKQYMSQNNKKINGIFLETAHPFKFVDIVQNLINKKLQVPDRLKNYLDKNKRSIVLSNQFKDLKQYLLQ